MWAESLPLESERPGLSTNLKHFLEFLQQINFTSDSHVTDYKLALTLNVSFYPDIEFPKELFPTPVPPIKAKVLLFSSDISLSNLSFNLKSLTF